jgi:hypothetical protein
MTLNSEHGTLNSSSGAKVVRLKKPHPCGGSEFIVVRQSLIVILKCATCGSIVRIPKDKYLKSLKT